MLAAFEGGRPGEVALFVNSRGLVAGGASLEPRAFQRREVVEGSVFLVVLPKNYCVRGLSPSHYAALGFLGMERWLSGLRRAPGKRVHWKRCRGFESRPLRQPSPVWDGGEGCRAQAKDAQAGVGPDPKEATARQRCVAFHQGGFMISPLTTNH